MLFGV
jgi:hypothetical protein